MKDNQQVNEISLQLAIQSSPCADTKAIIKRAEEFKVFLEGNSKKE